MFALKVRLVYSKSQVSQTDFLIKTLITGGHVMRDVSLGNISLDGGKMSLRIAENGFS